MALNENIGPKIPEITITADSYYLLKILKERLEEVKEGKINLNENLISKVFWLKN